jgi:endonuclease I
VAFSSTDVHRNDANTADIIWDIYSDNPTGPEVYTYTSEVDNCGSSIAGEGACYNREHTFPQAWFGATGAPLTDLFALYPTDGYTNGQHNNYPYSEVTAPVYTSVNGSKLGTNTFPGFATSGIAARAFEVIDEYKGDIARNYFYMVTRYQDEMSSWQGNSNADDVLDGTTWPSLDEWYIKLLYKWHLQDPVSQKEINRNDSIYKIQNNRNPFIDHPEYVTLIWQCTGLLPVTLIDLNANKYNESVLLLWTVSNETNFEKYEIERSTDGANFSYAGVIKGQNLTNYSFTDKELPSAKTVFYRLKMIDIDGKITYSKIASIRLSKIISGALVYPNPAKNILTVKLQNNLKTAGELKVVDVVGRTVLVQTLSALQNNIQVDVKGLPAGRYFVAIRNKDQVINESFVIAK